MKAAPATLLVIGWILLALAVIVVCVIFTTRRNAGQVHIDGWVNAEDYAAVAAALQRGREIPKENK